MKTQENKNAFLRSVPIPMLLMNVRGNTPSGDLKPSQELLEKIALVKDSLNTAGKLVKEAYDLAIRDGFNPQEARQFLTAQLPFLAERTIRLALPAEAKDQSKVRTNFAADLPQKPEQNKDNVVNITTKATIQDADLVKENEEPSPLELAEIKIKQLEDALKKTDQFKPATQLEPEPKTRETGFEFLKSSADGIHSFYYDAYGIDLFKNRELAQLKNSGVKVFRRLYFEV